MWVSTNNFNCCNFCLFLYFVYLYLFGVFLSAASVFAQLVYLCMFLFADAFVFESDLNFVFVFVGVFL